MFFSVINKNLHWEFINKNLVTFKLLKDEMKLGVKNFRELCKKPKYRGTNIYINGMLNGMLVIKQVYL